MEILDLIPKEQLTPIGRIKKIIAEIVYSIRQCREQRLFGVALITLYAGIDIMASLNRLKNTDYVNSQHYQDWLNQYLLPNSDLSCSAIDLYAARCGVLHSLRYDSSLSENGRARQIRYIFDNVDAVKSRMGKLENQNPSLTVVVFDELLEAFEIGANRFISEIENDLEKNALVLERINSELIFFPLLITK